MGHEFDHGRRVPQCDVRAAHRLPHGGAQLAAEAVAAGAWEVRGHELLRRHRVPRPQPQRLRDERQRRRHDSCCCRHRRRHRCNCCCCCRGADGVTAEWAVARPLGVVTADNHAPTQHADGEQFRVDGLLPRTPTWSGGFVVVIVVVAAAAFVHLGARPRRLLLVSTALLHLRCAVTRVVWRPRRVGSCSGTVRLARRELYELRALHNSPAGTTTTTTVTTTTVTTTTTARRFRF